MTGKIANVSKSILPTWIVFPVLAGLVLVCGFIVMIGWLIAAPSRVVDAKPAVAPVANEVPMVAAPPVWSEPIDAEPSETPHLRIVLPRRLPKPEEDEPPNLPSEALRTHTQVVAQPMAKHELKWMLEKVELSKRGETHHLILPIEVAKIADVPIPYNVRRLQLPGDAAKAPKLAITPFVHDDVAKLLSELGQGERCTKIPKENLQSMEILKLYDVVFLTCAELYVQDFQASAFLRKYVELGGTLYASDLQYDRIIRAFPEYQAKQIALPGVQQNVEAVVTDQGLQTYLGHKTIPLSFDAPDWRTASFDPTKVTVCLKGLYRNQLGKASVAPLLVKFRHGQGTVIFTSFHHSRNETPTVRKMLEYLAIAPLNARSEARLHALMRQSEFTPDDLRPLLLHTGEAAQNTYEHTGGGLQIALGFEHVGAKIKLTLRAPNGQIIEHEDQGVYLIEVPSAAAGSWQYTITPVELPQRSLPMINAIGRTRS
jgi:hypothetical protein